MAWWLAYEELYGNIDEEYPIMNDDSITFTGMSTAVGAAEAISSVSLDFSGIGTDVVTFGSSDEGTLNLGYQYGSPGADTLNFDYIGSRVPGGMGEDHITFNTSKPQPNLKDGSNQKYQEDKGIEDLKSYVASTYKGHYTNKNSDVQTLDLIHSVGDAESFCRSNALKYLSRYDKKGSAKNDILKAMHYCLLLYYFSGNTQEPDYTNTRYETF